MDKDWAKKIGFLGGAATATFALESRYTKGKQPATGCNAHFLKAV
jgi:hypothetical protein